MSSRVVERAAWVILLLTWIVTILAYPALPPTIATHFAANGAPNGTMNALVGAFILPFIMLLVLLFFATIPRIDPLRINIQYFRAQFNGLIACIMFFFACVQASILAWNLGYRFDEMYVVLLAAGVLIFYIGILLPQTRRNWFIGIRTPWTISSDHVWQKTHELGGLLFKVLGVITVLGVIAPTYGLWIIVVPLVIVVIGLVLYSYVVYEQDRIAHV